MQRRRGTHRGVFSALFDDPDYQALSSHARLVLLTARLSKQAGPGVIFRYYPAVLAEQTGLSASQVERAAQELTGAGWVECDGRVFWVRNGLRHDPTMALADPKHRKGVERSLDDLPHCQIVLNFCDYYGFARPFEGPGKGHPTLVSPNTEYRIPNTDTETEKSVGVSPASTPPSSSSPDNGSAPESIEGKPEPKPTVDATWLETLKRNPAYRGIDVDREIAKAQTWLALPKNKGRKFTRPFVLNWLNRVEPPLAVSPSRELFRGIDLTDKAPRGAPPPRLPSSPPGGFDAT